MTSRPAGSNRQSSTKRSSSAQRVRHWHQTRGKHTVVAACTPTVAVLALACAANGDHSAAVVLPSLAHAVIRRRQRSCASLQRLKAAAAAAAATTASIAQEIYQPDSGRLREEADETVHSGALRRALGVHI